MAALPEDAILRALRRVEVAEPEERRILLCFLAGRSVTLDASDVKAALRRAELLLAAGGDPRRPLELHGRAVSALAEDLGEPARRTELCAGLASLDVDSESFPCTAETLATLRGDEDLSWLYFAMALLAEALSEAG